MRVLIVKLSSMGDVLHALPTVAEIKRQTGAEIHWAVHPAFAQLVRCFSCVDRVHEIPRKGSLRARWKAIHALRMQCFDWVVDLQGLLKSALVAKAARRAPSGMIVGPGFAREGAGLFYAKAPALERPRKHAVEECLDVLQVLGLERPSEVCFPLDPPDVAVGEVKVFRVAVAPASRWETKNWPLESFAQAVRLLHERRGAEIHVIGGGGERAMAEEIGRQAGVTIINHCGELDIPHSCGLLRHMDCLLTNDSGPMHLAAAVGIRCVAIFGPTNPSRTGPYGKAHTVLQSSVCPPCHKRVCARGDHACMKSISPDGVVAEILGE